MLFVLLRACRIVCFGTRGACGVADDLGETTVNATALTSFRDNEDPC